MHLVTFIFVIIELVLLFYLGIHMLARPDDKNARLNIILILFLLTYNITGGLLPDPKLPGSFFIQEIIAYATGFGTPCYFPFYVYQVFELKQFKFHAYRGVFLFLILPYLIFVGVFVQTGDLSIAQSLLVLPVLYAAWMIISLIAALRKKYRGIFRNRKSLAETTVLLASIVPWIGLPAVTYFDISQSIEALIANFGFLMLLALQAARNIRLARTEHERLMESERLLQRWNTELCKQVKLRTKQLERVNEQRVNNFIHLVHEIKTPLTLVKNYLDEYTSCHNNSKELAVVKGGVDKLVADVVNLFDMQRFIKGIGIYDHNQVSDFSEILKRNIIFFEHYSSGRRITWQKNIDERIYIKASSNAINRIVNNIIENAIKFSTEGGRIKVTLREKGNKMLFVVEDDGIGIDPGNEEKIFEPYFQISRNAAAIQGMGLGLPIVKTIVDNLGGSIDVRSAPARAKGTEVAVTLYRHDTGKYETASRGPVTINKYMYDLLDSDFNESAFDKNKKSILLVEDSRAMLHYLSFKLIDSYNIYHAFNGEEALKKLAGLPAAPDMVLLDIMMDKMDGFRFAKIVAGRARYNHIPIIFLTARSAPLDKLKGLRLGAVDYISKPFSFDQLKYKIENILNNLDRNVQSILYNSFINPDHHKDRRLAFAPFNRDFGQKCRLYGLTNRETEITELIKQGKSYKLIAEALYISEKTVGKHIEHIFEKMGASNKMELINKLL